MPVTSNKSAARFGHKGKLAWGLVALTTLGVLASVTLRSFGVERTEDAYVQGNIVQVTSQVAGTVVAIHADDTQWVREGTALVRLNPFDYELALERAKAALVLATRQARIQFHQVAQLQAEVRQRRNDLAKATQDLQRRQPLSAIGAISAEELQHAADLLANARDALEASQQQLAQRRAMTERLTLASHPDVQAAASRVKDAYIALHRTEIPAPVSGVVSRRNVQVGQRIAAGPPLMSVVALDQLWVNANFKESQLQDIRVGQPVTLTADVYGDQVVLHGQVAGLDAGTGSAFALLPAQNATGNWIKVTQRLPVRIELKPEELQRHPLRIGMSMRVSVDTRRREGTRLEAPGADHTSDETRVFAEEMRDADDLVQSIIAANAGEPSFAAVGSY